MNVTCCKPGLVHRIVRKDAPEARRTYRNDSTSQNQPGGVEDLRHLLLQLSLVPRHSPCPAADPVEPSPCRPADKRTQISRISRLAPRRVTSRRVMMIRDGLPLQYESVVVVSDGAGEANALARGCRRRFTKTALHQHLQGLYNHELPYSSGLPPVCCDAGFQ